MKHCSHGGCPGDRTWQLRWLHLHRWMYSPAISQHVAVLFQQAGWGWAVPQTHRETPHKGARVEQDFGQRSDKGTCVRRTNGSEILCWYHIDKRLHPIRLGECTQVGIDLCRTMTQNILCVLPNNTWLTTISIVAHTTGEPWSWIPIEMVWSALKRNLEREGKPRNKVQLIDCIKDFWRQHLTPQVCQNYIGHFKKVVTMVVEKGGKASRIWTL